MFRLDGKVALVTGSSRGIGKSIALKLAQAGADVIVNYLKSADAALQVKKEIESFGRTAICVQADTSKKGAVERLFETIMKQFGKLDISVNNAGIVTRHDFLDMTEEEWDEVIDCNLKGYFLCGQQAARIMVKQKGGRIINISSISQFQPAPGRVHYCASKGGINMLTKGMALELGKYNITVNAIGPGATETDFTKDVLSDPTFYQATLNKIPLTKIGKPDDMAGAVLLLTSDEGSYITGQTIFIDGGYLLYHYGG